MTTYRVKKCHERVCSKQDIASMDKLYQVLLKLDESDKCVHVRLLDKVAHILRWFATKLNNTANRLNLLGSRASFNK